MMVDNSRPLYHFTPPSRWMNDPNGLVYYKGEYHLFYQHHPHSDVWGPMHWGHAVSPDLVRWQHLPVALYPDEHGTIFSGSAVVDWRNTAGFGAGTMVAIFTYRHKSGGESQGIAFSLDRGRSWTKYNRNPVLFQPENTPDFRDPKVFRYQEKGSGHWVMVLAAGSAVRFYRSSNLVEWEETGKFGGQGAPGGVWETPDLFQLPLPGRDETRWVLTVGVGGNTPAGGNATRYFIGDFDGLEFVPEFGESQPLWADHGADFYAAQTWSDEPDNRRVVIAWMNNWVYADRIPTRGWRGVMTLPRLLTLAKTENGLRLRQQPVQVQAALRGRRWAWEGRRIEPGENLLSGIAPESCEILADFKLGPDTGVFGIQVCAGGSEAAFIGYDPKAGELFIRRRAGLFDDSDGVFSGRHAAALELMEARLELQIFLDRSSIEVFGNGGLAVLTDLIFPPAGKKEMVFYLASGTVNLIAMEVFAYDAGSTS